MIDCIMFCLLGQVTGCDSDLLLGVSCYYWMLPLDVAVINYKTKEEATEAMERKMKSDPGVTDKIKENLICWIKRQDLESQVKFSLKMDYTS